MSGPALFRPVGFALLLATVAVHTAPGGPPPPGADRITAQQLEAYLTVIAADAMEGRATPSRGLDRAAAFLAVQLGRWGLVPAGDDGTYLQRFPLHRRRLKPETTTLTIDGRRFVYGDDFLVEGEGVASGPLVFVGHGYRADALGPDPYAGLDVKGRILIVQAGRPRPAPPLLLSGTAGEDFDSAETLAAALGALAIVRVPGGQDPALWDRRRAAATRADFDLGSGESARRVPVVTASTAVLQAIFSGEALTAEAVLSATHDGRSLPSFALASARRLDLDVGSSVEHDTAQNVVALLEGSDPALKHEVVALGAHYDHVGLATEGSDRIFNGADDNGSGTAAILAIAEAVSRLADRPRRSMLFVWHAGEENGLLGSRWLTDHPPVPLEQIVAQLNIDMIGRSRSSGDTDPANAALTGPHGLYVIGSRVMSRALGALSDRVNREYLGLEFDYRYDDPADPEGLLYRSDHYNYARRGVPFIFYFSGLHEDYHRPGDSVDRIDFTKMERVARTIYATALALADAPRRPAVERQLPPQGSAWPP
jgi:hypothetical protein